MKIKVVLGILVVFLASCSPQAKLKRNFMGERISEVSTEYGSFVRKIELENGNQLFVYKKETPIRPTIVDPGQHTLDPRISPGYTKIEWFKFEINKQGIIVNTFYKKEIER